MFYTYILVSEKDGSFYIGHTNNIERRISDHNKGFSRYTKTKIPWKLLFLKKFESRSEAMYLEKKLKSYKNKIYLLQFIKAHSQ